MNTNKLIIASVVILGVLIVTTFLLRGFFQQRKQQEQLSPAPTSFFETGRSGQLSPLNAAQQQELIVKAKNINALSPEQSETFEKVATSTPVITNDCDLGYSLVLDKYFISKKTPNADEDCQNLIEDQGLSGLRNDFPELFVETTEPLEEAIEKAETKFLEQKAKVIESGGVDQFQTPTPVLSPKAPSKRDRDLKLFTDLLKTTLTFDLSGGRSLREVLESAGDQGESGGGGGAGGGGGQAGGGGFPDNALPSKFVPEPLANIFIEAGENIGMPPKLLEAFMRQECGHVITFPPKKIEEYSTPGKGLPPSDPCFGNSYGARGPMQFLPSTFAVHAHAVKQFGNYNHKPYIENILDSVYAAANKIKVGGSPKEKDRWTREEVYRAGEAYCGSCNHTACPNYCASVWSNYSGN